jgi:hypothetical protein
MYSWVLSPYTVTAVRFYFLTIVARWLGKTESIYFRKVLQCSEFTVYVDFKIVCDFVFQRKSKPRIEKTSFRKISSLAVRS